jgi:hypothetical protein
VGGAPVRYRVQYCLGDQRHSEEIEAGSPEEAVVKFRLTRPDGAGDPNNTCRVLSVTAELVCDELPW